MSSKNKSNGKSTFMSVHIIKSLPISRPNADDTGQQKSTNFGGVIRSRISSQCLKRSVRNFWSGSMQPNRCFDFVGQRTKFVRELVKGKLAEAGADEAKQEVLSNAIVKYFYDEKKGGEKETSSLTFVSDKELDAIVKFAISIAEEDKKEIEKSFKKQFPTPTNITADVGLFGRMQASATNYEVYAAAQVAHAIGVNAVSEEFDFFTAVDDVKDEKDEQGAGHIGNLSCNSSCYYIHANVCFDKLVENLNGAKEFSAEVCAEFVKALALSNASGKSNTFAHQTMPSMVMVEIHNGQSVNLVNAFETPVTAYGESLSHAAIGRLLNHRKDLIETFGDFYPKGQLLISSVEYDVSDKMSLPTLCDNIADILKKEE